MIGLVAAAGAWAVMALVQAPIVDRPRFSADDGVRAQRKIVDLARRPAVGSVVLTEPELNAFVARHLDPADLPLRETVMKLRDDDIVEISGTVRLSRLLHESPMAGLAEALPAGWLEHPVWMTVRAYAAMATEPRRELRLEPRRVAIGRQRVPAFMLRLVLDPSSLRLLRIGLPSGVQTVRIERGRVVIQTTSSR